MSRERDVLTSYGFEFKKRSWIDEESDGPGYWESATHKVVPHNDDRYSIVQFAQIVDYDDEAKIFHTEEMDCPSVCYWGMIDWEDEDFFLPRTSSRQVQFTFMISKQRSCG